MWLPVFTILTLLFNAACAGADIRLKINPDTIEANGFGPGDSEIDIFDGDRLSRVKMRDGKFRMVHGVSSGYQGVVFIHKKGYYPEALLFKVSDKPADMNVPVFRKIEEDDYGVLIGIFYMPAKGGKIMEHNGIKKIFRGENVELIKDSESYIARTDDNGIFRILLEKGRYRILMEGKEVDTIVIEAGKTAIRNLRKGVILID